MKNIKRGIIRSILVFCALSAQVSSAAFVLNSGERLQGEILRASTDAVVILERSGEERNISIADLDSGSIRQLENWRGTNPDLAMVYHRFDQPPAPVRTAEPARNLIPQGASGMVSVAIVISASGEVVQARIHRSQDERLNEAALDAIQRWSFQPARNAGQPVASYIRMPFRFN